MQMEYTITKISYRELHRTVGTEWDCMEWDFVEWVSVRRNRSEKVLLYPNPLTLLFNFKNSPARRKKGRNGRQLETLNCTGFIVQLGVKLGVGVPALSKGYS